MRIAIVNWTDRKVGGAESYMESAAEGLRAAGHDTALFCEVELPGNREQLQMPNGMPIWCASKFGLERAINGLRKWQPDVIYGHGLLDPGLEAATLQSSPAVFFAHGYYGTCISGDKAFKRPAIRPCSRRFGWQCFAHYYPHRCGGLNPLTMGTNFLLQSRRLKLLHSYHTIITASEHMRCEYLKQGFAPESVKVIPLPVDSPQSERAGGLNGSAISGVKRGAQGSIDAAWRLLFVGRMEVLKGGGVLLDALPQALPALGRRLHATFVGDGRARDKWEQKAISIQACEPRLKVEFTGWLEKMALEHLYRESDLLVIPSLWPEPFGLVGPEAGAHALPAVAFAVGGIAEWLVDGLNGSLASGNPPTAEGLASAIVKCLGEPSNYDRLRRGALEMARGFNLSAHISKLVPVLQRVAAQDTSAARRIVG